MARFVFRLEPLLTQRLAIERERQLEVAKLERERLELEDRVRATQVEVQSHKADLRELLAPAGPQRKGRAVETRGVRLQANAALSAQARTQHLAVKLAGVYQRLEAARSRLRTAAAERRAIELLRERQFQQWKREADRREASSLDEIGTMYAGRSRVGL